jgi:probable phosphoglycerate mutase
MHDQLTRIIAIRHGETAWNVDTRIQGQLDVPLNDTGRWQAQRLGRAVADEGIAVVYASDLLRAYETARAVADNAGCPIVTDVGLRERHFGEFEGFTWQEIEQRWPEGSERWRKRDLEFAPEGGESLRRFYARSIEAETRLAAAHPGQTIAFRRPRRRDGTASTARRRASTCRRRAPGSSATRASTGCSTRRRASRWSAGATPADLEGDDALDESADRVGSAA